MMVPSSEDYWEEELRESSERRAVCGRVSLVIRTLVIIESTS